MPIRRMYLAGLALALSTAFPGAASAQAVPVKEADPVPVASASPTRESEVPDVPGLSSLLHGFNGGVTFAGIHDSVVGWSTLVTPAVGYSFNDTFTVDVSVPIYFFRLAPTSAARPRPNALLINERGEVGDVFLSGHAQFVPRFFEYQATASLAIPTGPPIFGLTTGKVSFDFTNHFERTFGRISPSLDLGIGNSASLVNRITTEDNAALGPLSHYQIGIGFPLPKGLSFDTAAYEQLPIGDQKIYTANRAGRLVVTGRRVFEDNGFTNSLDVPISGHMTFSAVYNRSLRFHADTVSIGYTFILRSTKQPEEAPAINVLIPPGKERNILSEYGIEPTRDAEEKPAETKLTPIAPR